MTRRRRPLLLLAAGWLAAAPCGAAPEGRLEGLLRAEQARYLENDAVTQGSWLQARLRAGVARGEWEWAAGARIDLRPGVEDGAGPESALAPEESFLRWRGATGRLTAGWQTLSWGRVYELPPGERLARVDFSRFILDPLPERRRPIPALRLEQYAGGLKLDAVWAPQFEPAVMPDRESPWYPIDTRRGRILGIGAVPLVRGARIEESDPGGGGGGGLRLTGSGEGFDYGVSLQRARQSLPYYELAGWRRLTTVHPESWVAAAEWEAPLAGALWRLEAAFSSDLPVTERYGLAYRTHPGVEWVAGCEFHPGDGETRVNLQLAGRRIGVEVPVLEPRERYSLMGELERDLAWGRWRARLRFLTGLDQRELYLNPRLSYHGFGPHELVLAAHLFDGDPHTPGGFYADNDLVTLGWELRF